MMNRQLSHPLFADFLETMLDASGMALWSWNPQSGDVNYSEQWKELLGLEVSDFGSSIDTWASFVLDEDLPQTNRTILAAVNSGEARYELEYRMRKKDGSIIWVLDKGGVAQRDDKGNATRLVGVVQDITRMKHAEAQLKQNARSMFDVNAQPALIFNREHHVIDCNPAALEFYGYKDKQALFSNMLSIVECYNAPDGHPHTDFFTRLNDVFESSYYEFESQYRQHNRVMSVIIAMRRIKYDDDFAVIVNQYDTSSIKTAEHELTHKDELLRVVNRVASKLIMADEHEFVRELHESMAILGQAVDVQRVYIWQNHMEENDLRCTQIYEWTEGAEPQQGLDISVDISYAESAPTWIETFNAGRCVNAIVSEMSQSERDQLEPQGVVSILVVPIYLHTQLWGFIGFDDCKQARIFLETEENILHSAGLILASALLRNEIMRNLVEANIQATQSARAKSSFLANMSHEIRTPLNAIIGMTTIAQNSKDPKQKDECLNQVKLASKHLVGIVNDVLDMSKIEARKFELNALEFSFSQMIKGVHVINAPIIAEKQLDFNLSIDEDMPDSVVGDELRLTQVINNLLSNAVKFTPTEGKVELIVKQINRDTDRSQLNIIVRDTGIGIGEDHKHILFSAFEQEDLGINRKYSGTGLGLAICKSIVELMGGNIEVDSVPGVGSTFTVDVPIQLSTGEQNSEDDEEKEVEYNFTGKTILLAEDIEINREIVIALLAPTGVTIESAENGQVAHDKFKAEPDKYDLIFMDIHMPMVDGYTATELIRSLPFEKAKRIPIVAMTANAFAEDIERCLRVGMHDHIAKPVDVSKLLHKTKKYIDTK